MGRHEGGGPFQSTENPKRALQGPWSTASLGSPLSLPKQNKMKAERRKEIKRDLTLIANGSENRMPLWSVMDLYTCRLMREAVTAIESLEKKRRRK
jgi:hypothetical protein